MIFSKEEKVIITQRDDGDEFNVGDIGFIIGYSMMNVYRMKTEDGRHHVVRHGQLAKFIEPKFEINYKFEHKGRKYQIVQRALNKKKQTFYYMCYSLSNGFAVALPESAITEMPVKMTIEQVKKALGKNIIIVKK